MEQLLLNLFRIIDIVDSDERHQELYRYLNKNLTTLFIEEKRSKEEMDYFIENKEYVIERIKAYLKEKVIESISDRFSDLVVFTESENCDTGEVTITAKLSVIV